MPGAQKTHGPTAQYSEGQWEVKHARAYDRERSREPRSVAPAVRGFTRVAPAGAIPDSPGDRAP
jgi:hypothetical protein